MSINDLYTEIIMMHNKSNHHLYEMENPDYVERGHNPNCGDDLTLEVNIDKDNQTIKEAAFIGSGCAISKASMSIMLDLVIGKTLEEAQTLTDNYLAMIKGETLSDEAVEALQDAAIFESLSKMPARVKCGTLGWHCLKVILKEANK